METMDAGAQKVADAVFDLVSSVVPGRSGREFVGFLDRIGDAHLRVFGSLTTAVVGLLDIAGAGVILGDAESPVLRSFGGTPAELGVLDEIQIRCRQGPAIDCLARGETVQAPDLDTVRLRWPALAEPAARVGITGLAALPLRAHDGLIGSMTLVRTRPGSLDPVGENVVQVLADAAAIAALRDYSLEQADTRVHQLQTALDSRVRIEQAKGVLAARLDITPDEAFVLLRTTARSSNRKLTDVSDDVLSGRTSVKQR